MIFQAFIDDSGTGAPVFVLSGYVTSVERWEMFSESWHDLLDMPPQLPYFKMREAVSGFGGRLKGDALHQRVDAFTGLIAFLVEASFSSIIPINHYNRILRDRERKEFDDPYFLALFDIVVKVFDNQLAVQSSDTTEFIFDDNPRLAAKVPAWYQLTRAVINPKYRHLIGTAAKFENDKEFLPLQAADLQSWYFRRLFAEKLTGKPFPADIPKGLFERLDSIPSVLSLWTPERMQLFLERNSERLKGDGWPKHYKNIHEIIADSDRWLKDE